MSNQPDIDLFISARAALLPFEDLALALAARPELAAAKGAVLVAKEALHAARLAVLEAGEALQRVAGSKASPPGWGV